MTTEESGRNETERIAPEAHVVIRPSQRQQGRRAASFYWVRGTYLAELIYVPWQGLRFAFRNGEGAPRIENNAYNGEVPPVAWMEDYARTAALRLPTGFEPYGTLAELAADVRTFVSRYFDCEPIFKSVATLYVFHTWIYERFHAVPYLRFLGPPSSGKTRATEVIGALCYHPLTFGGSVTPASMYRMIEAAGGTLLLDEADFRDSDISADVVKVLNCGYQQNLPVTRMEQNTAGEFVPRLYQVFGPKILNGRRRFTDDAVETRCLTYAPNTTSRADIPTQLPERFGQEAACLQRKLLQWRFDTLETAAPSDEYISTVSRRMNQIILPLVTVADMLGPERERYRSELLQFASQADSQSLAIRAESPEAAIVRALLRCVDYRSPPTCKDVAELAAMDDDQAIADEMKGFTPRRVSHIVRELGFPTRHTRGGSVVLLNIDRLRSLAARFGIDAPSAERTPEM